jgi:hypothetical protein
LRKEKNLILTLLGITCILVSCNKPIPFNKDKWVKCGGFDGRYFIGDDHFVEGNTRYKMALWLEENYNFCDKSLNEILEKFYIIPEPFEKYDSLYLEKVKTDKKLKVITKQYNPNFKMGIDPWIDTDWIEIYFDGNYMASKVYYVHYEYKTKQKTERNICTNH